ncbi:MAG TPA: C1 family peptidase, partial [Turneriella sp.]|nr:C1 family peptidase [Turneriella sp.]
MKKNIRWIYTAIVLILIGGIVPLISIDTDARRQSIQDRFNKIKAQNDAKLEQIRKEVTDMNAEIKRRSLSFQVEINEKMKEKMANITGLKPPKPPKPNPKPEPEPEPAPPPPVPDEDKRSQCDPSAEAFDWRSQGVVPAIRDQKSCGDCYMFAAMASYETALKIRNNHEADMAEQYFLNCTREFGCDGGWYGTVWTKMTKMKGDVETNYPYQAKKGICKNITPAGDYRVVRSGYVSQGVGSPQAIKNALCEHGVLA